MKLVSETVFAISHNHFERNLLTKWNIGPSEINYLSNATEENI